MRNELENISNYVENIYRDYGCSYLLYHNLDHTKQVVFRAKEIAQHCNLNGCDRFIVLAAAWFHDIGHLCGDIALHEEKSVEIMREYFKGKPIDDHIIACVEACIMATKMPVAPSNLLEEILCDADTFHLGTSDFFETDKCVWDEMELRTGEPVTYRIEKSIGFLTSHKFFTPYCQKKLQDGKVRNILCLRTS
ncbi:MAG: HD domain-containing protein [Flavobacterium lindanitolerans]|uniref:HD domain-containing protein n=1 Tax=Flavobacterium lindanitolerans TaxID=428988 RepID=UPI001A5F131B|nr:HD domain-containing protein [Flavobacterium lindanitolerans]MBL7867193.1 HD domain-containing protein [Flavobacterium lindanitolerans]